MLRCAARRAAGCWPSNTLIRRRRGGALRGRFDDAFRRELPGTGSGVWRYGSIVLPATPAEIVSHPEGNTPLLRRDVVDDWTGVAGMLLKHEGQNPTGSFKDRGHDGGRDPGTAHRRAPRWRALRPATPPRRSPPTPPRPDFRRWCWCPTARSRTASWRRCWHTAPSRCWSTPISMAVSHWPKPAGRELGIQLLNSINPFRLEGQKTIVFELLQQLEWQAPDWIVVPAGNLGNTAAFGKALAEAMRWGLIDRMPRLAAVQAAGAAPFAAAFARGFDRLEPVVATTRASAIRIGAPASYRARRRRHPADERPRPGRQRRRHSRR